MALVHFVFLLFCRCKLPVISSMKILVLPRICLSFVFPSLCFDDSHSKLIASILDLVSLARMLGPLARVPERLHLWRNIINSL